MHFKLIFTLFFQNVNSMFVTEDAINFKLKYPKLADLLDHYAPGAAAEKYLQYGCNCNFLEDKPLASSGNGATLDPIDQERFNIFTTFSIHEFDIQASLFTGTKNNRKNLTSYGIFLKNFVRKIY